MKNLNLFFLAAISLALGACSSNSNSPEAVAEKFNKAIYTADFNAAKALCTDDSKQAVDLIASFVSEKAGDMKKANVKYETKSVNLSEDGNSADVEGVVLNAYDLQNDKIADSTDTKVHLVKENGKWLVDYKLK
ncbi:MAG TPA: DUF4878 domain-containing protein [Paludibacteraceae bacterium]|jgi:hypothetical protein|nr:DUF4878 domain-containing protein [Paludibacteraceae bacterium]HOR39363.1 DUF4878 domain-containing protein [Paludibacteraceae bacterium]HPQ13449.1 DUF4878 domain-containing protein [Paludibacteraceae bacterium]HRT77965.1 DUF4878 domain-containing protein [Paludibacteraceae bacterium]